MSITKSMRTGIKIIWICLLVVATPFVIQFGFMGMFAFVFSGFGGSEMDGTYLLMTIVPTAVLALGTYYLFKWLLKLEKQELYVPSEEATISTTIEEQQIVNALQQNGGLTLNQITSVSGIEADKLMPILKSLMSKGIVGQKIDNHLAIFFLINN